MVSVKKIAQGMVCRGSLTSSATFAMSSNPIKAKKDLNLKEKPCYYLLSIKDAVNLFKTAGLNSFIWTVFNIFDH